MSMKCVYLRAFSSKYGTQLHESPRPTPEVVEAVSKNVQAHDCTQVNPKSPLYT